MFWCGASKKKHQKLFGKCENEVMKNLSQALF